MAKNLTNTIITIALGAIIGSGIGGGASLLVDKIIETIWIKNHTYRAISEKRLKKFYGLRKQRAINKLILLN